MKYRSMQLAITDLAHPWWKAPGWQVYHCHYSIERAAYLIDVLIPVLIPALHYVQKDISTNDERPQPWRPGKPATEGTNESPTKPL